MPKKKKNTKVDLSSVENTVMKPPFQFSTSVEPADSHSFWKDQPVPKYASEDDLDANKGYLPEFIENVRTTPLDLPGGYEWITFDLLDDPELQIVHDFLKDYYIEDTDGTFKFHYSPDSLRWCMCPPGYSKTLHIGVKSVKSGELIGFISGAPCHVKVYRKPLKLVEINFLCVHPKYRHVKLAPLLIKEVARRVKFLGMWQAIYTGTLTLPHSIATTRYYHRALNVRKLVNIEFMPRHSKMTLKGMIKYYDIPSETQTPGLRVMRKRDISGARQLLNKFLEAYHITMEFTVAEFEHTFMPRDGVVYSYVVEDPDTRMITDFISFYSLGSNISGHPRHNRLEAAYSFYNVAGKTSWSQLIQDALILAKLEGFDVFNCLDIMENSEFIKSLRFMKGSGELRYHLYNWKCLPTRPDGIGVVMR